MEIDIMYFKTSLKKIDIIKPEIVSLRTIKLKAQYNPNRFKYWNSIHKGPSSEVLNMLYSSHYRFLKNHIEQNNTVNPYYQLQKLYGRNDKWIKLKIEAFKHLYKNIKKNGYDENKRVTVLNKPIIKNKFNNSYEIFEGHHRVSICLLLGIDSIKCDLKTIL